MNRYSNLRRNYSFDKGLSLVQCFTSSSTESKRMITANISNRAISKQLYNSLDLSPEQKANLGRTLVNKGIFDTHGNQLITKIGQNLAWDHRNQLQTTVTQGSDGQTSKTYSVYAKTGQRNRQVTEKTDDQGQVSQITEALYQGHLEYRTTWQGTNLSYDGETVTEKSSGQPVDPYEQYSALRLRQGHKQVAQKRNYTYKEGIKVFAQATSYTLDNNIDSCDLTLKGQDRLESFESYKPYGESAISYGRVAAQPYKYSGQERDESGLYYYGFRSLDPETYRWVSPDPAGIHGSGLNWYAMTGGNPITFRDIEGLGLLKSLFIGTLMIFSVAKNLKKITPQKKSLSQVKYKDQLVSMPHISQLMTNTEVRKGIAIQMGIWIQQIVVLNDSNFNFVATLGENNENNQYDENTVTVNCYAYANGELAIYPRWLIFNYYVSYPGDQIFGWSNVFRGTNLILSKQEQMEFDKRMEVDGWKKTSIIKPSSKKGRTIIAYKSGDEHEGGNLHFAMVVKNRKGELQLNHVQGSTPFIETINMWMTDGKDAQWIEKHQKVKYPTTYMINYDKYKKNGLSNDDGSITGKKEGLYQKIGVYTNENTIKSKRAKRDVKEL